MHAVRLKNLKPNVALITILAFQANTKMSQGSSSGSPQGSASNRRKEVYQVNDSLYELYKPEGTPKIQVLFFHGLRPGDLSDAHISTWKSADDSCIWPQEWLPDFFPGAHIFSVSYSACDRIFDLYLLGENLISDLVQGGVGQITSCPLILVGHCVGGLVIKETCCQAHYKLYSNKAPTNHKEKLGKFLRNIRGVFYYSTPHHGSSGVVTAANGPLFKYFRSLYAKSERLNAEFEDVELSYEWLVFGLGASLPIVPGRGYWNWLLFNHSKEVEVPEASSRQGNHFLIVVADHNSICQPTSIIDKRFYHLKNLIDNIVTKFQEEGGRHEETRANSAHEDQNMQQESDMSLAIATTILSNESSNMSIQISQDSSIEVIEKPGSREETRVNEAHAARLKAMEPIICMLKTPVKEGKWTHSDEQCVRKLLLTYIYNHELDDESISHLLKLDACPPAQLATLRVIGDICLIEEKPLFCEINLNFLQTILHLLRRKEGFLARVTFRMKEGYRLRVPEEASRTLLYICRKAAHENSTLRIVDVPGVLHDLVSLLPSSQPSHYVRAHAAWTFAELAEDCYSTKLRIANQEGALVSLVKLLCAHNSETAQEAAANALINLTLRAVPNLRQIGTPVPNLYQIGTQDTGQIGAFHALIRLIRWADQLKLRIATQEGAVVSLVKCLALYERPCLQNLAAVSLLFLAESEEAKAILEGTEGLLMSLSSLLADGIPEKTHYFGARALTSINPTIGKEVSLTSAQGYKGRADAFSFIGIYTKALPDLDVAVDLTQGADAEVLSRRSFVKSKLGDFEGALADANEAVKVSDSNTLKACALQERGVLKRMKGDLVGALADLDEGMELKTDEYERLKRRCYVKLLSGDENFLGGNDEGLHKNEINKDEYERLKHRGYVKFLLGDKEGARSDAEWALRIKPPWVDHHQYGRAPLLLVSPTEYMGYKLK